jgi:hypothetical protein
VHRRKGSERCCCSRTKQTVSVFTCSLTAISLKGRKRHSACQCAARRAAVAAGRLEGKCFAPMTLKKKFPARQCDAWPTPHGLMMWYTNMIGGAKERRIEMSRCCRRCRGRCAEWRRAGIGVVDAGYYRNHKHNNIERASCTCHVSNRVLKELLNCRCLDRTKQEFVRDSRWKSDSRGRKRCLAMAIVALATRNAIISQQPRFYPRGGR